MHPWSYRRSLGYLTIFVLLLEAGAVIVADLNRPPWGDERHFVETVGLFAAQPTIETLRTYPEMSGPLPFALYAVWGRLFGLDLWVLRLLSLLVASLSYLLFHRLLWRIFGDGRIAFGLAALLAIHPYMVGFSIFVFTDGVTILLLLVALFGLVEGRSRYILLGLMGALLCRQYAVFAVMAMLGSGSLLLRQSDMRGFGIRVVTAGSLATIPLLLLFVLWGGVSPENDFRLLYLDQGLSFHPSHLVLYISLLFYYLLPVVAWVRRRIYLNRRRIVGAFVLSLSYWLFPVEASPYAKEIGVETVGLLHKAVIRVGDAPALSQAVFYTGYLLGLPVVMLAAESIVDRIRSRIVDSVLLLDLTIIAFLAVMPWSYLNWEKYLMPLVPFALARLAALGRMEGGTV